jgi:hypothetical protein
MTPAETFKNEQGEGALMNAPEVSQTDYMTDAYVARHGSEPSIQQKAARQKEATAQADITAAIKKAYPNDPVSIRMVKGSVGTVLVTGFDNALRAIAAGNAELVTK